MFKFIKENWNIFIGILSAGGIIVGILINDQKNTVLSISISIFASWLLFFLADFLPTTLKNKKAFTYIKPKLKNIYDEINNIDDILCFYVNISVDRSIDEKADSIKHVFSIDTIWVHEEIFFNPSNPLRFNHPIGTNTIEVCIKTILNRIVEIEKFWAYLPLEIAKSIETIRENCEIKNDITPRYCYLGTIKGVMQNSENTVLENKYKTLIKEIQSFEKYGFKRIKRTLMQDTRSEMERKTALAKALSKNKGENK